MKKELRRHVRHEQLRSDDTVLIRGGPDTLEKLVGHAHRMWQIYVLDDLPVYGVSAVAALDDIGPASEPSLLAERLVSYRLVHRVRAGELVDAGFGLLPTFGRPHITVLLASDRVEDVEPLLDVLGVAEPNPYHGRPRR